MAATNFTPISLYYSTTASAVPTSGNLVNGELALNTADMKLYAKNSSGVVTLLASSGGAAGTVSSVAVSGGTTGLTTSGGPITTSGTITLAGTLATTNGGTNLTSFTSGGVVYASSSSALATGSALTFDGTNLGAGGATSPSAPVDIQSNSGGTGIRIRGRASANAGAIRFFANDNTTQKARFESNDTSFEINSIANLPITFATNDTEGLRLTSSSLYTASGINVGIGTSSPADKLHVVGTGTNAGAGYLVSRFMDSANAKGVFLGYDTDEAAGTIYGANFLTFQTYNGTSWGERLRLDIVGNLGLGVTPSAWGSTYTALQVKNFGLMAKDDSNWLYSNSYFNGTNNLYTGNGYAGVFDFNGATTGGYAWRLAASGTAGTVASFTQAMTLDASGNLGLGATTTAGGRLVITQSNATQPAIYLPTDESTIQGPNANTKILMGGNLALNGNGVVGINAVGGSGIITLATANTERARIDSSGNLLVGTTSVPSPVSNYKSLVVGGTTGGIVDIGTTSTSYGRVSADSVGLNLESLGATTTIFRTNSAERARFSSSGGFSVGTTADPGAGAIYATGNITAYYSDARLKTVSGKIENALDKVAKLSGVYYTNNDTAKSFGYDSDEVQVGVLAQEVEAVMPEIVKAAPFDLDENNNSKSGEHYKTVQYDKLVPLLIEAINELRAEVKALKGTI